MKYTTDEIDSAVKCWEELSEEEDGYASVALIGGEPVKIEKVDGKAGEEDGGSHIFVVIKVGDQYFRKTGYYASHYGTDWDGILTEVHPVEKTVTVYESA